MNEHKNKSESLAGELLLDIIDSRLSNLSDRLDKMDRQLDEILEELNKLKNK